MWKLNIPVYDFKFKEGHKRTQIFDPLRKKYLTLTPEEWVRQNFTRYLIREHHYPSSLIKFEAPLKLNTLQKYADVLVYDKKGKPFLIVECKAPTVKITQDAFDQAARYNLVLKVPYLIITNGMQHYCCHINHNNKKHSFINDIPPYPGRSE